MTSPFTEIPDLPILPVRIIGDHPWAGFTGKIVGVLELSLDGGKTVTPMARVRLDDNQNCPHGRECFAEKKNMRKLPVEATIKARTGPARGRIRGI